nr:ankyrin repeat-containing domain, PGG domain protein [Tanacetum cinerariifolium]
MTHGLPTELLNRSMPDLTHQDYSNNNQVITDIPIYKAALLDDWDSVSHLFEEEPGIMTKQITYWWVTPLIIAVGTNRSNRFVKKLVERIVEVGDKDKLFVPNFNKNGPLHYAAKFGNTITFTIMAGFYAMKQRQERVYNLIYQMSRHQVFVVTQLDDAKNENALHMVAKLASFHRLNVVTGAALQMQRELQWFEEVEKIIEPLIQRSFEHTRKNPKNGFHRVPCRVTRERTIIDERHSIFMYRGCCTRSHMAFAAAFTVPGGNQYNGKPLFLDDGSFMLFIVADAIALFSSTTSVLMFLGILTSRSA